MRRWGFWGLVAVTVLSWAPILLAFGALGLAAAMGCDLNQGSAMPCLLPGRDLGGALQGTLLTGWLILMTGPFAVATGFVWTVLGLRALWRRFR